MTTVAQRGQEDLEQRITRLEKERIVARRWLGLLLVLLISGLFGAGTVVSFENANEPSRYPGNTGIGSFSSISTKSLVLVDDNGKMRAALSVEPETHTDRRPVVFKLFDETGGDVLALEAGGISGPTLNISSSKVGSVRAGINGPTPLVEIRKNGKTGALLWFNEETLQLVMSDKAGRARATFGYESAPGYTYPVAIFDASGKVVWSSTKRSKE